jgi:hypothetical protein
MIRAVLACLLLFDRSTGLRVSGGYGRRAALTQAARTLAVGTAGVTGVLPPQAAMAISKEEYKAKKAAKAAGTAEEAAVAAAPKGPKAEVETTKVGSGIPVKGSMKASASSSPNADYTTAWVNLE